MKTNWKTLLIGTLCIVWGLAFFVSCSSSEGFDWSRLSLQKYEKKSYIAEVEFQSIALVSDTDNIVILPSADQTTKVEYTDSNVLKYDISVSDGTLYVKLEDNRKWYHYINVYSPSNALTIYLPEKEYSSLNIQADTGDITIGDNLTFGTLEIRASTGDLSLSELTCDSVSLTVSTGDISVSTLNISGDLYAKSSTGDKEFNNVSCNNATFIASTGKTSVSQMKAVGDVSVESDTGCQSYTAFSCASAELKANTGDISMVDLVASAHMEVNTSTGDVSFDNCDAASLSIQTSTGSVTGTFRTPKIFYAQSSSGKVEVPSSTEGGLCQVQTSTGRIKLSIAE